MPEIGLFLLLALSGIAQAEPPKRMAIVFGGNCEESAGKVNDRNQFLVPMHKTATALKAGGWSVNALYDGDQARCSIPASDLRCDSSIDLAGRKSCCAPGVMPAHWRASWFQESLGKEAKRASRQELLKALADAEKLPPGSQLLLSVHTHGGAPGKGAGHSLCMSDGALMPVDDPDFLASLERLKNGNVKNAVTDESCFSGGSVPVLKKYGCVVSSQTENRVSYGSPISNTIESILSEGAAGSSLADVFQKTIEDPEKGLVIRFSKGFGSGVAAVATDAFNTISPQISGLSAESISLAELESRYFTRSSLPGDALWWHEYYDRENACKESVYGTEANYSEALAELAGTVVADILPELEKARFVSVFADFQGLSREEVSSRVRALAAKYFSDQESLAEANQRYGEMLQKQMNSAVSPIPDLRGLSADEKTAFLAALAERSAYGMFVYGGGGDSPVLPLFPLRNYEWKKGGSSFQDFLWQEAKAYAGKMLAAKSKAPPAQKVTALGSKLMPLLRRAYEPVYKSERADLVAMKALGQKMTRLGKDIEKGAHDIHQLYFFGRATEFQALRDELTKALAEGRPLSENQRNLQACEDFLLN